MFFSKKKSTYSLNKSRSILHSSYSLYKKKGYALLDSQKAELERLLSSLDQAVLSKDVNQASDLAKETEAFCAAHFKKSSFEFVKEIVIALIFALAIATVVRQTWFELYEIPTGSMRPTFKEKDHVTVTKVAFGINMPLATDHIYFDPDLVQRTSIVVFSADNLPMEDTDSTYFWVFPYKKRYVKRLMGKPGDTIYFYGGKLYGIDKDNKPITELLDSPWLDNIEHIPFVSFQDRIEFVWPSVTYYQMNEPLGKINLKNRGDTSGEVLNGDKWVKDQAMADAKPHNQIETYSDYWGIKNYAMTRLLTKEQVKQYTDFDLSKMEEGTLYLELSHTPSMSRALYNQNAGRIVLLPYKTIIPLKKEHLDRLMDNMYTSRFVVKNGLATLYRLENITFDNNCPKCPEVPDGTYEFYFGKADKIEWAGITSEVPKDSPLYSHDPLNIQKFYNLGIEFHTYFSPQGPIQYNYPHRYAYFRDGDLYLLGVPIVKKDDPILKAFAEQEKKRQEKATNSNPYVAFTDYGPPVNENGEYDIEFIKTFGLKIPEKQYLCLGDNHSRSSDSRVFGFVPEANLQGAPSLIIWPPGDRLGRPPQKPYPIINCPRMIIWSIVALLIAIYYVVKYYRNKRPTFKKI